jgi:hypothetical protein
MAFKITNMTANPRVFTDRHGAKVLVPAMGTKDGADLDQDTADYINELTERKERIAIEGEVSSGKARVARRGSGADSAIARQTMGDPSRTSAPIQQAIEDLGKSEAELAALRDRGGDDEDGEKEEAKDDGEDGGKKSAATHTRPTKSQQRASSRKK